jgi:DNA-binding response OmpR family regulator
VEVEPVAQSVAAEKQAAVSVTAAVRPESGRETKDVPQPTDGDGQVQVPSTKKPRILVVDDDASIRTIVTKSLEQLPFPVEIQSASNGVEGFEMVQDIHPDMVVLDIMMPGMDGFEVCQKLRSQVETAFIPVIMLTANPSEEGRIKGYLAGTDDYLAKPFNVAELHARVSRLLRRAYGIS